MTNTKSIMMHFRTYEQWKKRAAKAALYLPLSEKTVSELIRKSVDDLIDREAAKNPQLRKALKDI